MQDTSAALRHGLIRLEDLVELGQIIANPCAYQRKSDDVTLVDLTGVAVQGIAAANLALAALDKGHPRRTAGNLLSPQHFNGKTATYAYATGKRASMGDASGTTDYTYDSPDRLTAKATPEGTLNYTYDAASNIASMSSSNANGSSVA